MVIRVEQGKGGKDRYVMLSRKRCSAPTFRIEVGSVSLRFGF
jgi:hypothetical protein